MHRSELTQKQQEALDKIAAAGPGGLERFDARHRVTINGNCVDALYRLGLIESWMWPFKLTEAGRLAQSGQPFTPARWVAYSIKGGQFMVPPTFNYGAALAQWEGMGTGRPDVLGWRREDEFRRMHPDVEIAS